MGTFTSLTEGIDTSALTQNDDGKNDSTDVQIDAILDGIWKRLSVNI